MAIENAKWYVLHTYSGYENMVKENLVLVFKKNDLLDKLVEITIPMEDVVEEKNGKTKIVQRRMMPSYVFIKMDYNNDMWHIITNTRGVTGFVGPQGRPLPLSEEEVARMGLVKVALTVDFAVGDTVQVVSGPLESFTGKVVEMTESNQKVKVDVEMFGRITNVELDFVQVKKVAVEEPEQA